MVEATTEKLEALDNVLSEVELDLETRWDVDWHKLMDGKRVLGQYAAKTPFQTKGDFIAALQQTIATETDVSPPGISKLRERIRALRDGE